MPRSFLFLVISLLPITSFSQGITLGDDATFPKVRDLNWLNETFLNKQRTRADELTRGWYGQQIKSGYQSKSNLALIQRVIDDQKLDNDDREDWQAFGIIIGDIFVQEMHGLNWRVYEDEIGNSHAVCYKETTDCLFPVTMLSRRTKVGIQPDVKRIYQKGLSLMAHHKPKLPYSAE